MKIGLVQFVVKKIDYVGRTDAQLFVGTTGYTGNRSLFFRWLIHLNAKVNAGAADIYY